jgi:hypothetical protein
MKWNQDICLNEKWNETRICLNEKWNKTRIYVWIRNEMKPGYMSEWKMKWNKDICLNEKWNETRICLNEKWNETRIYVWMRNEMKPGYMSEWGIYFCFCFYNFCDYILELFQQCGICLFFSFYYYISVGNYKIKMFSFFLDYYCDEGQECEKIVKSCDHGEKEWWDITREIIWPWRKRMMGYHSPGSLKEFVAVFAVLCLFLGFSEQKLCMQKCFCNKPGMCNNWRWLYLN